MREKKRKRKYKLAKYFESEITDCFEWRKKWLKSYWLIWKKKKMIKELLTDLEEFKILFER